MDRGFVMALKESFGFVRCERISSFLFLPLFLVDFFFMVYHSCMKREGDLFFRGARGH